KERLKIFYTKDDYFKYSKNFYNNNSMFGFKISNDKMLTEKFLKLANVPTTNSIKLSANQFEKGMEYLVDNPSPKVVKPINLANGRGVFVDVTTDNFREVWEQCVSIQKQRKVKYPKVLIQDMVTGLDRKSTRLNSSHVSISYAVFCLKKKRKTKRPSRHHDKD